MSTQDILDCIENRFVPGIPGLRTAEPEGRDLLGRIKGALLRELQRVDDLPRDHPVWKYMAVQTVNPYRLTEHSLRRLRDDPLETDALWTLIADNLANGGSSFPQEHWQSLLLAEKSFDADWPIFAGLLWSLAVGSPESVEELSLFLTRNGLCERAIPTLKSLEAGENEYARTALDEFYVHDHVMDWARQVHKHCTEGS
jgi:hypothetical protein